MAESHSSSTHPHSGLSPKSMRAGPTQSFGHLTSQLEYSQRRSPNSCLIAARLDEACKKGDGICRSFPLATAEMTIPRNCGRVKSAMCSGGVRNVHGVSPWRQALYTQSPYCAVALEGVSCGPLSPKA